MHVKKAFGKYNPNIAGVLSETPGYRIYAGRDNWKALALVGRVAVKVSDENGAIKIWGLLTSSSKAGIAMKAVEPGATLGIALEIVILPLFSDNYLNLNKIVRTIMAKVNN